MELFYRDAANLKSVRVAADPELRVIGTTTLFSVLPYASYLNRFTATYDYDPATDRFLMPKWSTANPPGTDIQVIENGFDLLNRLAPRWDRR